MTTTSSSTGSGLPMRQLLPLLLSVFISLMGFGVVLPVFPFWGRALGAGPEIITLALGAYSLGQFVGAPLWGKFSDSFGRRPALIGSLIGIMLSYMLMAEAENIYTLGAARLFGGLMAGNIGVAFAYVGDVVEGPKRPKALGLLGAAFGMGFIFGPAIGGVIAGDAPVTADFARVAHVAAGICVVGILLVIFGLPESLDKARRQAVKDSGSGPTARAVMAQKPAVLGLMLVAALVIGSAAMMETTFALFADDHLGWSPRDVGLSFGLIGTISAIMQAAAAAPLSRRFGARRVALIGIFGYALGLALLGVTGLGDWAGTTMVLLALAVTALGVGIFNPAFQTMVAAATDDRDRGLVNGLTQGASAGGRIIGPAVSGSVYVIAGMAAPFLAGAALMLVALVVAARAVLHGPAIDLPAPDTDADTAADTVGRNG
jgi:DHA1 family tetracycline resistance protein-like MFS transporter